MCLRGVETAEALSVFVFKCVCVCGCRHVGVCMVGGAALWVNHLKPTQTDNLPLLPTSSGHRLCHRRVSINLLVLPH